MKQLTDLFTGASLPHQRATGAFSILPVFDRSISLPIQKNCI